MKIKKWLPLLLAGLMTVSIVGFTGCVNDTTPPDDGSNNGQEGENKDPNNNQQATDKWNNESIWLNANPLVPTDPVEFPTAKDAEDRTTNVSVHDPSIFHDPATRGYYYAFGTHFAVAKSYDLIEWEQVARDNDWSVLYDESQGSVSYAGKSWPKALDDTLKIVSPASDISTTWAPDVEYYNGKYYMYYSITKAFGSNRSAIGRVESDNPLGPYDNNVVIIESVTSTDENKPNCIDPELFYDKDGKLWMVYGSFFGGVYIKELYNEGENWGLPKETEGWGKLLWRNGYSAGVEGPYVFYNASTDYYYLMVSEDDLNTVYNMRVARSKNPDGPYEDITGKDVAADGMGNKIAGNYKFARQEGKDRGYGAMGHNSVIKDKQGRYFVVYHTRRQDGMTGNNVTAGHNLYVSQLYFNEEGWPVMSPNAYVGEKAGTVTETQVAADYEIVLHSVANSRDFVMSEDYTLTAEGKVAKASAEVGAWTLKQNYYIEITIDSVTYKGVVVPGFDMYKKTGGSGLLSITAVSNEGRALWALAK